MCGIAGIVGSKDSVNLTRLQALAALLAHRGPDDQGIEILPVGDSEQVVGLVHRRLSIIDLSPAGHQPMHDETTGNWISFNGEIYNYREARSELEGRGHKFRSESDTEVILKAYAEYGVECVKKLRGMFAFAILDARAQKLFLAVDRFGIKPLYIYERDGVFAFASEIKALLKARVVPREIDPRGIESFLFYGAVQAPLTMVKGVRAMLPGEYAVYDVGSERWEVGGGIYWKPHAEDHGNSFNQVLEDTVRHHLIADVPVGLFLSGGVDSSALAILVNRVAGRTLDSFSVTFEEKEYAEGKYARMIGEKFCARHHEVKVSNSDLAQLLPAALDAQDQPSIDGVNAYVISKAVRDAGIKVVLSGQGGDEVFGGYPTFRRIPRMVRWWKTVRLMPKWKRTMLARMIGDGSVTRSKLAQYLLSDGKVETFYAIARQLFSAAQISFLVIASHSTRAEVGAGFHSAKQSRVDGIATSFTSFTPRNDSFGDGDIFSKISLLELRGYLANTLLRDGDVMSMAHGLEVRVPYLDNVLLEQVMSTPVRKKVARNIPKPLLLNALRDEMPREIWARKKMGFTFPWELWLRGSLRGEVDEVFHDTQAAETVGLNLNACRELWHEFLARKSGITWSRVWGLYVLLRWAR